MQNDLNELLERIILCYKKNEIIHKQILDLSENSIKTSVKYDKQPLGDLGLIYAKVVAHPPVAIRQEVGMIMNEQRAILDALACKLAIRNGSNNIRGVYFPIAMTKAAFYEKQCQLKIRKLSESDKASIEALKPWCPPDENLDDGNHIIFQLHQGSILCRHHPDLIKWAFKNNIHTFGEGFAEMIIPKFIIFKSLDIEANIAMFRNVTCSIGVNYDIVFNEPPCLYKFTVIDTLNKFNEEVEKIVRSFI